MLAYNPTPPNPPLQRPHFVVAFLRISVRLRKFVIVRQVSSVHGEWGGIRVICALIVLR